MKFLVLAAALAIPVLAMPEPVSRGLSLDTRDIVKLNLYRTLDDCYNDRNILYHAAPVSGKCYDIDGQTGAFFINTGGFSASKLYSGSGCNTLQEFQVDRAMPKTSGTPSGWFRFCV